MTSKNVLPRTWGQWWAGDPVKLKPARSADAAQDIALQTHFRQMLDHTEPPATFRLLDVALMLSPKELKDLGYEKPEQAVDGCLELAFEWRTFGDLEILRKGKIVGDDVEPYEIDGPVRIRRKTDLDVES